MKIRIHIQNYICFQSIALFLLYHLFLSSCGLVMDGGSQRLLCLNPNTVLVVLLLGLWLLLGCHNYSILRLKCTSLGDRVAGWLAGRVLEEMELEPTQPPTAVEVGLGFGLSLAKIQRLYDIIKHCIAKLSQAQSSSSWR